MKIVEVVFGVVEEGLGLERLDESAAQGEQESTFQVLLLRRIDGGVVAGAFEAQFALMLALVEIAEGDQGKGILKGTVGIGGEEIKLVDG